MLLCVVVCVWVDGVGFVGGGVVRVVDVGLGLVLIR